MQAACIVTIRVLMKEVRRLASKQVEPEKRALENVLVYKGFIRAVYPNPNPKVVVKVMRSL